MRKIRKKMDKDQAMAVLHSARRAVLAMNGEDGYPYAIPINFVFADGRIWFHCAKAGQKIDCLKKDSKVCLTTWDDGYKDPGDWAWRLHSVVVFGRVHFVEEKEEKIRRLADLGRKYFPTEEEVRDTLTRLADNCLLGCVTIDHITGKNIHEK